jgi:two-component system response regulator HydG
MREVLRRLVNRWRDPAERIAVLAVTRDDRDRHSLQSFAPQDGWDLQLADSCESALEHWKKNAAAVILCDRELPGVDWQAALEKLAAAAPACAIVLMSPVNDEYLWEEVIRRGGYDVLVKPLLEDQTVRAVHLAWSYAKERARS